MRQLVPITTIASMTLVALVACAGGQRVTSAPGETKAETTAAPAPGSTPAPATENAAEAAPKAAETNAAEEGNKFVLRNSDKSKDARGAKPSKIKPTATEAAMKFFVIDKDKGPVEGIVVSLTAPDGKKYYTEETDADGYAEVLVPVGQKYDLVYLTLGRRDIAAQVSVTNEPQQNIKLTLRYKRPPPAPKPLQPVAEPAQPRFVLRGVTFDTGKATIRPESFPKLDIVAEFMTHKKKARIEISGHTDNVGNPKVNKTLSEKRAHACRSYLISKGIEGSRIQAVGHGDERPIASNDTDEGRQENRRIEAMEL